MLLILNMKRLLVEPDIILADIITTELGIDPTRVVVSEDNYQAPTDDNLYIIIAPGNSKIIGSKKKFNPDTNKEIKSVVVSQQYNVELVSKNREALNSKEEVIMAITSDYATRQAELNNFQLYRNGDMLNLSSVEGSSSLRRWRIPLIMTYLIEKRETTIYYDKYRETEEVIDG